MEAHMTRKFYKTVAQVEPSLVLSAYRERMGWNDQSVTDILLDFIASHHCTHVPDALRDYLEERAQEEESWDDDSHDDSHDDSDS
jgi:hypothetical protein